MFEVVAWVRYVRMCSQLRTARQLVLLVAGPQTPRPWADASRRAHEHCFLSLPRLYDLTVHVANRMPDISFVFGPRNSFFFDCPQTWKL